MPPKAKYTKEEIIAAALEVTRLSGIEAVTAREVGKQLNTSSSPVFSAFKNMEELVDEVRNAALNEFNDYIADAVNYSPIFKQFGFRLIEFAKNQPNLFQLLCFSKDTDISYSNMIGQLPCSEICVNAIMAQTQLNKEQAKQIFDQVLLSGLGICYLVSTNKCDFTQEDLDKYLGVSYLGSVETYKNISSDTYSVHPKKQSDE